MRTEIFRQTSTIGVREIPIGKTALDRGCGPWCVDGHAIHVKLALHDGEVVNAQPEYEDVAAGRRDHRPAGQGGARRRRRREPHLVDEPDLMDLAVIATTFAAIFVVELPDKTFIAALVLSTRYRPLRSGSASGSRSASRPLIAVTAGALATLLPDTLVKSVALAIFLVGAFLLFRTAPGADAEEQEQEEEFAAKATETEAFVKAVVASFLVLFAAEWGDLSQLLTISLVAKYDDPLSVFVGAWGALLTVSGLAVLAGRVLLRYMRLSVLHYIGAAVCLVLAGITRYELSLPEDLATPTAHYAAGHDAHMAPTARSAGSAR